MPLLRRHRLLLLLLLVAASHGDSSGDTYDASMCQLEPKPCGNVSISYPFYFAKDRKVLRGYADSYCGYPGLEILCEDDKPILQLNDGENYTVMGIDVERANVTLADPEVLDERCPRVDRNVTIPPASWLYFPSSMVDHIVFLLGCSPIWTSFQKPTMYQISCQSFDSGDPGESFVLPEDKVPPGNLSRQCRRVIEVPVLKYEPVDPVEWRNDGYGKLLRLGFQLAWNASGRPAPCAHCERSSGRCGYNKTGDFISCLCTNGRLNSDSCSSTGNHFESETTFCSLQSCRFQFY